MHYKIAIADDHPFFRMGVKAALTQYENLEIVFEACDGIQLLELLSIHPVDVVLLDLKMPNLNGLDALKEIRLNDKELKILIFSMYDDAEHIKIAHEAHSNGYLIKNADPEEIYLAILSCMTLGYYDPSIELNPMLLNII